MRATFLFVAALHLTTVTAAETPNIVFILSDDVGVGSLNCYGAAPKLVRTPHLDTLAQQGRRFTDANTPSSVCSPTRYAVLTGRYCWRTSLKHEVLGVHDPLHIETTRLTLASLLKRRGYNTAAIGKWHLGYGAVKLVNYTAELKPGPLEIGFDYHFGVPSNHGDITGVFVENRRVAGLRSSKLQPFGKCYYGGKPFIGLDAPQREDEKVMEVLTDKTVAWIEQQDARTPFFLYFTPVALHEPATPSAKTKGTSGCGPYGDWTHDLDNSVGRVMEILDRKQFSANTLLVFTSDNGGVVLTSGDRPEAKAYEAGLRVSGSRRGRKHSVFEGGFRVPFIARWPGRIPPNSVCDETVNLVDMLATTAALVGEKLPPRSAAAEDSYDVLPALLGEKHDAPLRPDMIVHSADGNFAIRQGSWKWIEGKYHPATRPGVLKARAAEFHAQLYNLKDDPAEEREVQAANPEIVRTLSGLLDKCRDQGYTRQ